LVIECGGQVIIVATEVPKIVFPFRQENRVALVLFEDINIVVTG
jgi:hypothetical protein